MSDNKKSILTRVYLVYAMVCLFGLAIVARIWHIQVVEGEYWRAKADSLTIKTMKIEPARGNIFSTDGSLLATSVPIYDLRVDFKVDGLTDTEFNSKIDSLALSLSWLFRDKPSREYKRLLVQARREGKRYFLLKKNVSHKDMLTVKKFPMFRERRHRGGLITEQKNKRVKPFELLAARTIGYKIEGVEPVGIEGAFDDYLKGVSGHRLVQRLSGGVWKPLNDESEIEPQDGNDVITTIDLNLQDVAENSLYEQLSSHNAEKGCAILMEVQTGEVMAIANLQRGSDGNYHESFNFGVGESTEPGSTFKLASMMALLEDGYIDLDDTVDTQGGRMRFANRIMRDSHEGIYGKLSMQKVFEVSSNVGISRAIHQYYSKNPQAFVDRLRKMGLGQKLELQIKGEGRPYLKNTDDKLWSKVTLPWLSIGYECSFTPLQMLTFYNAVANNGKMVTPVFVKEIRNKGQVVKEFKTSVIRDSIASPETIRKAQKMLEGVVENGTASHIKHAQYKIAGKTGTAQIANAREGYKSGKIRYQASFVGYFPAEKPRYSCIVVVYAPNNNLYYASQVAAPIFKEIADKVYATSIELHKEIREEQLLTANLPVIKKGQFNRTAAAAKSFNIPVKTRGVSDGWVQTERKGTVVELNNMQVRHDQVPSVVGMGLRDAVYMLEGMGLQVKVIGRGAVVNQSISAGSKIEKGQEIVLQLG